MKWLNIAFILPIVFLSACADPCDDVACGENGTCVEGVCECDPGVFGDNCENLYRDDFLGSWNMVTHFCEPGSSSSFVYTFEEGAHADEVIILNSQTPDYLLIGNIDSTILTIHPQIQVFGVDVNYFGNGELNDNGTMFITVTAEAPGQPPRTCNSFLTQ